jgi:hypothetical protein
MIERESREATSQSVEQITASAIMQAVNDRFISPTISRGDESSQAPAGHDIALPQSSARPGAFESRGSELRLWR